MAEIQKVVDVNMNGQKIKSLADPTSAQDAATKNYVDTTDEIELSVTTSYLTLTGNI